LTHAGRGALIGAARIEADVAIVGFGPVGATLAGLLGRRGLSVVVVERETGVFKLPRAAHIDHTGLRTLQELDSLDALLPAMRPNPGLDFVSASGELLMRVDGGRSSVSGLPASMYFHQPGFDAQLRDAATAQPSVQALLGTEAVGLDASDDGVVVRARGPNGDEVLVCAGFAIGCDGSWSPVREWSGMTLEDLRFEERWLVVDLLLSEPVPTLAEHAVCACDPARPLYSIPMPARRHRFEFMLLDGEDDATMLQPPNVARLLEPWVDPAVVDIERSAVYTFHGLVADQWRAGRVLIAGDAAHQMPPFLGQGMCSGIRDAANLAWKLDHVVRSGAPLELLDTYQLERRPHVRSIIESAVAFGRLICVVDPVEAEARDQRLLNDPRPPTARVPFLLPSIAPGPLVRSGGGELFIQPASRDGSPRLDDIVGQRFLIVGRTTAALGSSAVWWAESLGALVTTLDALDDTGGLVRRWMDQRKADVVVVRPDRCVLAAGAALDPVTDAVRDLLIAPAPEPAVGSFDT
jgi:3-(3-hydroxy-phenyl)propionate hydroxylase